MLDSIMSSDDMTAVVNKAIIRASKNCEDINYYPDTINIFRQEIEI